MTGGDTGSLAMQMPDGPSGPSGNVGGPEKPSCIFEKDHELTSHAAVPRDAFHNLQPYIRWMNSNPLGNVRIARSGTRLIGKVPPNVGGPPSRYDEPVPVHRPRRSRRSGQVKSRAARRRGRIRDRGSDLAGKVRSQIAVSRSPADGRVEGHSGPKSPIFIGI